MGISWKFLISIIHGGWDITVWKGNCNNFATSLYEKMTAFVFSYQFHINIASKSADTSAIFLAKCLNLIFDRKVTLKCRKTYQKSSLLLCPYITPFIENRFKVALVKKWQKMWVVSDLLTPIQLVDVTSLKNFEMYLLNVSSTHVSFPPSGYT